MEISQQSLDLMLLHMPHTNKPLTLSSANLILKNSYLHKICVCTEIFQPLRRIKQYQISYWKSTIYKPASSCFPQLLHEMNSIKWTQSNTFQISIANTYNNTVANLLRLLQDWSGNGVFQWPYRSNWRNCGTVVLSDIDRAASISRIQVGVGRGDGSRGLSGWC